MEPAGSGNTATWEIWGNNVRNFIDTWVNEPGAVNEATGLVDTQFYLPGNVQIMDDGRSIGPWGSPSNNWNFTVRGGNNVDPLAGGYISVYGINSPAETRGRVILVAGTLGDGIVDDGHIVFNTGGGDRWKLDTNGVWKAYTDNVYDIGSNGANRPRTIYAGTSMISPIVIVNDNPYNATTWDGSFIVPTENAVRDEIESLRAAKQNAFTTGDGVTNIANVLSGTYQAGTNITFATNATGIQINVSTNVADTDGYTALTVITTTDGAVTPVLTNSVAQDSMLVLDVTVDAIDDGFGSAVHHGKRWLVLNDGAAMSIENSDLSGSTDLIHLGPDGLGFEVTTVTSGATAVLRVQNVDATPGNVRWRIRYKTQTHTY